MPLPRNIRNRNNKFDQNVTKRGAVPLGKAADRQEDYPVSKSLIIFFLIIVVGSSLVQVLNLFGGTLAPPEEAATTTTTTTSTPPPGEP